MRFANRTVRAGRLSAERARNVLALVLRTGITFLAVSLLFGVVAMLASYMPARRATKIDPLAALRAE